MAGTIRFVDTKFWSDPWIRKLNALDRYVFLYFLTNDHSSWCGVYELDITMAAFETGIDENDLKRSIMPRLKPKIIYFDGWVCIANFDKYHENGSDRVKKGIENAWKRVPDKIRLKIKEFKEKAEGMHRVSPLSSPLSSSFTLPSLEREWSLEEKLKEMEFNTNSYLDIIATFIREKGTKIENPKQLSAVIGRYSRIAKQLSGAYTNQQIFAVADKIKTDNKRRLLKGEAPIDWTIETIFKSLTK